MVEMWPQAIGQRSAAGREPKTFAAESELCPEGREAAHFLTAACQHSFRLHLDLGRTCGSGCKVPLHLEQQVP